MGDAAALAAALAAARRDRDESRGPTSLAATLRNLGVPDRSRIAVDAAGNISVAVVRCDRVEPCERSALAATFRTVGAAVAATDNVDLGVTTFMDADAICVLVDSVGLTANVKLIDSNMSCELRALIILREDDVGNRTVDICLNGLFLVML